MRYNVAESREFLQCGSIWKCLPVVGFEWNLAHTTVCLKPSNDRDEFEFDRARSKNNIAENSIALGHETDNSIIKLYNLQHGILWQRARYLRKYSKQ